MAIAFCALACSWAHASANETAVRQAIERTSEEFLGKPYDPTGPLGEGENGEVSTKPLSSEVQFDCVTFVEQVVARAVSKSPDEVVPNLTRIRYADGKISYLNRNHLTELDWIPQNIKNGVFVDITKEMGGGTERTATATIDRGQWLRNRDEEAIQRDLPSEKKRAILAELRVAADRYKPTKVAIDYIPTSVLLGNAEVRARIPSGSVFSVIRDSTRWILGGERRPIGTIVSHQGFIIRKNGALFLRHASRLAKKVVEVPFDLYLRGMLEAHDILGLNVLSPTGQPPRPAN
jgi:hypothetical protein